MAVVSHLGLMKDLNRTPPLDADRKVRAILEVEQQLVLLGQGALVSMVQDPLSAAP